MTGSSAVEIDLSDPDSSPAVLRTRRSPRSAVRTRSTGTPRGRPGILGGDALRGHPRHPPRRRDVLVRARRHHARGPYARAHQARKLLIDRTRPATTSSARSSTDASPPAR